MKPALEGHLDHLDRTLIRGWVRDPGQPGVALSLLITANDALIGRVLANRARVDLADAGLGAHGFELSLPHALSPLERLTIAIRRETDGSDIPGSPAVLPAASGFDTATQVQLTRLLAETTDAHDLRSRVEYLASQVNLLLQRAGDLDNPALGRDVRRSHAWRWGHDAPPVARTARRALVIDEEPPRPQRDAGSQAVVSHMLSLRRIGFEVNFAAADMRPSPELAALGIACAHAPWCASVEELLRRQPDGFDLVYLHRVGISARYSGLVRHYQRAARVVFAVADLHHLRLERQAAVEDRAGLAVHARRVRAQEIAAIAGADAVITHSSAEAAMIGRLVPSARVHEIAWSVPSRPTAVPFEARGGVAFIGYFGHPPNVDAARILAGEVMPMVRASAPDMECLLVGDGLPDSLASHPGVEAVGYVADLGSVFDRVRLTIAPLVYGAGVKGKVLASLAAGVPCVMTPVAAEGLDLPGILQGLVAPDAESLAALVLRLHEDAALADACREAGLAFVAATCSDTAIDTGIDAALAGIM